jgi:hypothetical protein
VGAPPRWAAVLGLGVGRGFGEGVGISGRRRRLGRDGGGAASTAGDRWADG